VHPTIVVRYIFFLFFLSRKLNAHMCIDTFIYNRTDQMGNKGAIMIFDKEMVPTFRQFNAVEHPPIKPMAYAQMANQFGF